MSRIFRSRILPLLFLAFLAAIPPCSADTGLHKRFFHSGNGRINLLNPKTNAVFDGIYRNKDGSYRLEALKRIDLVFGARYSDPAAVISLRLIEFLDYLQDHLRPHGQIVIISGYRSPQYNTMLRNKGGLAAKASLHQYGMAADIEIKGVPPQRIWNYVKHLGFGGAGYYHGRMVHVDVGPARSWDEKTSGVGTDISTHNKLIDLVTNYDIYRPGDPIALRFTRMTAFPIGVSPHFTLERMGRGGTVKRSMPFEPSFTMGRRAGSATCPQFSSIEALLGIDYRLPRHLQPGNYRVCASFCDRPWQEMPAQIATPTFRVVQR